MESLPLGTPEASRAETFSGQIILKNIVYETSKKYYEISTIYECVGKTFDDNRL